MTSLHSLCFIPLGLILALAGCALDGDAPVALGTLEVDRINVTAESAEPIVEVLVTEGDTVAAGDPLVRQDPERIRVQLKKAEADLAVAKAKLDQAEAGPRAQDIAAARAQLSGSQSDVKTARIELEREQSLVKQNYASQNNVDILEGRLEVAIAKREAAQATLDQLLEGTRSEEIDAARSSYSMAQTLVDDIDISLARTTLKAPVDGQVEAVLKELGERPYAGSTVVIIAASQAPYARVHIPEPLRTRLRAGDPAEIRIDGHDEVYRGTIRWIAHDASFTPYFALTQHDRSHLSYLAEIVIENGDNLPTGIPVTATFPSL